MPISAMASLQRVPVSGLDPWKVRMRHLALLGLLGTLLIPTAARAAEDKCQLDVATCLEMFARTRERPWLGIEFASDSTGAMRVQNTVDGSPAEKAGFKP